jgi:hypothetical protein
VASKTSLRDAGSKTTVAEGNRIISSNTAITTPAIIRARRGSIPPSLSSAGSRSSLGIPGSTAADDAVGAADNAESEEHLGPDMRALQEILRAYSSSLTLEWLLQLISDEIDFGVAHNTGGFLIDIMPNMYVSLITLSTILFVTSEYALATASIFNIETQIKFTYNTIFL